MNATPASRSSSCLLAFVLFGILSTCLCPMAGFVGGFSSTLAADVVAGRMAPLLCPPGSTAEVIRYRTTIPSRTAGAPQPALGYEMQCVDGSGAVVRPPSPDYAFYWIGLLSLASLVLSALLALAFAAPLASLLSPVLRRIQLAGPSRRA